MMKDALDMVKLRRGLSLDAQLYFEYKYKFWYSSR